MPERGSKTTQAQAQRAQVQRSAYALGFAIGQALRLRAKEHHVAVGASIRIVRGLTLADLMIAMRDLHKEVQWSPPSDPSTVRRACNDLWMKGIIKRASIPQDRAPPFALFYTPDAMETST